MEKCMPNSPTSLGYPENYLNFCKMGESQAMPNWAFGLFVIVGLFAVALLRENWRVNDLNGVAEQRGVVLHSPFIPGDRPPMVLLAERLGSQPNPSWGAGLTGAVDGTEIAIGEHEVLGRIGTPAVWYVILAWRAGAAQPNTASPLPPGTQSLHEGEWAAWRLPGNLTKAHVDTLLAHLPEARARF